MKRKENGNTKQKIYETAKRLYIEHGYFNISNKRLSEESGINQGLITYYFKSKKNIALSVLTEDYYILSGYLKYFITPEDDPLIYIVTFMNVTFQIRKHDPKARRFISDVMQEDLLEEFALVNQKEEYLTLLKKSKGSSENPDTQLKLVLATVYGTQRTIQRLINENLELSYDDYFRYMIEVLLFALNLPEKPDMLDTLIRKSNSATKQLFDTYPHLLNEADYLYKK
ncbi:TetR/AcrR family transcriptional regulator [Eubacterium sp. 1001713B170207_170306_E7]|uniref:TetR family transcriptional regulator n=1 Tax=Eubacterium sp. 1001713B170207_170306_E7 TaxID=2787097 RepID=UPI0018992D45